MVPRSKRMMIAFARQIRSPQGSASEDLLHPPVLEEPGNLDVTSLRRLSAAKIGCAEERKEDKCSLSDFSYKHRLGHQEQALLAVH